MFKYYSTYPYILSFSEMNVTSELGICDSPCSRNQLLNSLCPGPSLKSLNVCRKSARALPSSPISTVDIMKTKSAEVSSLYSMDLIEASTICYYTLRCCILILFTVDCRYFSSILKWCRLFLWYDHSMCAGRDKIIYYPAHTFLVSSVCTCTILKFRHFFKCIIKRLDPAGSENCKGHTITISSEQ
jgi:hypothetical protein